MSESESQTPRIGAIGWTDLTVANAPEIREFYGQVVGWASSELSMGDYSDYCMLAPETGDMVAGICHARGVNADYPAQWLVYITVEDVDESAKLAVQLGGEILVGPKDGGGGRLCVIRDPAGAVAALYTAGAAAGDAEDAGDA